MDNDHALTEAGLHPVAGHVEGRRDHLRRDHAQKVVAKVLQAVLPDSCQRPEEEP